MATGFEVDAGTAFRSTVPRRRLLVVAGEPSGDAHAAEVVSVLRGGGDWEVAAVGGPALRAAGAEIILEAGALTGMGLAEAAGRLPALWRAYRMLCRRLAVDPPDLCLLVDFPEFNLRLARVAKRCGVRVLYYVSPQVWAWRRRRVRSIARRVDRLAVLLPFEVPIYQPYMDSVEFVGHPLIDRVRVTRSAARTLRRWGLSADLPTVALLPGSRPHEIRYLLAPLLDAARLLWRNGRRQFIIPLAPGLQPAALQPLVAASGVPVVLATGDTYNVLSAASAAVVASGTAALEAALLECPTVIVYRLAPLTYALARCMVRVPAIGMPNLILGRRAFPELLQRQVTGSRIAAEVERLLEDPGVRAAQIAAAREVRRVLPGGAAERTAALARELVA